MQREEQSAPPLTDNQLLEIARQLWQSSEGVEFTMERLTAATGVSRATLYRRLGSREAILQRLVNEQAINAEELSRPGIPTRIMQATRAVLNRSGFAGLTIEQIAQEANVGPATIYRHFGSKEALLDAFMQENSPRQLLRKLEATEASDLEADLMRVAIALMDFIHNNRGLVRALVLDGPGSEVSLHKLRATQGRTINILANYLAGHIALGNLQPADPFALALSFVGILLGLALVGPHSYDYPITDPAAVARFAIKTFLYGIAPHGSATSRPQKLAENLENQR